MNKIIDFSFYVILDDSLCLPDAMPGWLLNILSEGITCVQLRMKQSSPEVFLKTAITLQNILKKTSILFIINDAVHIAKQINADGVHLGQKDMPVNDARILLGKDKIIGLSIENIQQAKECKDKSVNYFGVGPIFTTTTKKDATPPIGIENLNKISHILFKPIVAIGGINKENVESILQAGASGVAVAYFLFKGISAPLAARQLASIIRCRTDEK